MQDIEEIIRKTILDVYGLDFKPDVLPAPENIEADYSSNVALKLAKELHKAPMEIAKTIKSELETLISNTGPRPASPSPRVAGANSRAAALRVAPLSDISVSNPGFINFILDDGYLMDSIDSLGKDLDEVIRTDEYRDKTVICEFSDPNPFKVLHVGHLYTSVVGDAIGKLFEYAGAKVIRANFGGDVGLHVAKTMYILKQKNFDELRIEDIAKCYVEGTAAYDDDEKAHEEISKLNKEIYRINAEKLHDTPLAELYWKGRELSYDYFRDFYDSIGVKFDKYYPESTVAELGLETVKEQLKNGVYEMSGAAVIFDGEKYGLHTRVFVNSEGVPTYEAKDVGLIFTKWQDYHFDKSVIITGSEQLDYMKVVLKSVEQYAPELVERTDHLIHGLVKLPGGVKMSSRKGNFLKAVDVLNMVREELKRGYDSEDELIALAATKYAFLKYKMGGNIIFDPKESVKMTGNSGPYLLYSCVRAKKILSKASELKTTSKKQVSVNRAERNLSKKILEYKCVLSEAVSEMAPHKVANYLYELAQEFSRFYEHCPVVGSDKETERMKLVKVYLDTMSHGLNILGIDIPEEM